MHCCLRPDGCRLKGRRSMNKRNIIIAAGLVLVIAGGWFFFGKSAKKAPAYKRVAPFIGNIESAITATGTVLPQNRLEIKPPVSGRIEQIMVEEGQVVKVGDVLALMSSTDRAALMDAARLQGDDTRKNWEEVYKPTPLLAPISGVVIVRAVEPGQTVTQADAVLVLSDRLIVKAQVDETDIGKVKLGQSAVITLDAYPGVEASAQVDHISYESKTVSNVTIYTVDIVPAMVPEVFRSGMSANVKIVQSSVKGILLIPQKLVKTENGKSYVLLGQGKGDGTHKGPRAGGKKPVSREVQLGVSDGENVQVLGGITIEDRILQVVAVNASGKTAARSGSNPFMPSPPGGGARGQNRAAH
ncbi:MAG: efflux RND transporter periplasmic adaptor subunit [Candidatus Omnitrophica bacterium]|nr:efflux RND transporter periplasmic adaptor subunit [Candidatus Omnitrophota bacterium]